MRFILLTLLISAFTMQLFADEPLLDKMNKGLKEVGDQIRGGMNNAGDELNKAGAKFQESIGTRKKPETQETTSPNSMNPPVTKSTTKPINKNKNSKKAPK